MNIEKINKMEIHNLLSVSEWLEYLEVSNTDNIGDLKSLVDLKLEENKTRNTKFSSYVGKCFRNSSGYYRIASIFGDDLASVIISADWLSLYTSDYNDGNFSFNYMNSQFISLFDKDGNIKSDFIEITPKEYERVYDNCKKIINDFYAN
jgi:hypothetical protein